MGRVWLARDQMLDRDVAIKEIVPPDWMTDAEKDRLHNRTLREARSAARLTHPHVVRVYDVIHAEGLSWIVMEYVASRSLYQVLLTKGPYPPVEAARIGLAVLDALTAAHRAGVLHRDVKPHNVLIGSDGRVLLTDFGLATFVDDGLVTTPGLIVGSPQYVSPERARDGASTVESDLWSFGATLYATVEGQSPYARDSAMATLAALATEPPDAPARAGPLGPVLEGLLRYEPRARLTAEEAERQLRLIIEDAEPVVPAQRRGPAATGTVPPPPPMAEEEDTPNLAELINTAPVPAVVGEDKGGDEDGDTEDSGGWWHPSGHWPSGGGADPDPDATPWPQAGSATNPGYIEGTFTTDDEPVPAGRGHVATPRGGFDDNRPPADPDSSRPRPNRSPAAAGAPAASRSLRRGNQAPARPIPAQRRPLSGRLIADHGPSPRWVVRPPGPGRARTRLAIAVLLLAAVLGGTLLGVHLVRRSASVPEVVRPPAVAPSSSRASPVMPAVSRPGGFSPIVCDAPPPAGVPVAPQKGAARGVNGWTLQAGWSYFTDGTGFHLPVPDGWTYQRMGSTYCFRDPRTARVLSLDVGRTTRTDPVKGCRAEDRRLRLSGRVRDYALIAITPVTLLHKAADWDYRYRGEAGVLRRATTRWFAAGGHAYALGWSTPDVDWATEFSRIQMVRGTFYADTAAGSTAARRG
ncbi:hypothetical protein GCM10010168_90770 [Actinoplanes ianthinogenes]|uniref:non-specific serine/threonine protein kinase n=2 Tax=Actinoplanes ianthinogenes TaxID=122358 RepID=A0ABM7LSV6_9ACTN|nr:hypothetical protein Aiant_30090 [Actinoplanes ianthinogenes]GGR57723.1 hypothetical protein GCM10010168_90770 [Actinoplanes ianthinogenes]